MVAVALARELAGARERLCDRRGSGRRVAVHVAADPRAEPKRRRRTGQAAAPFVQQGLRRVEEAVLEEPEAVADLVGDFQTVMADLIRLPQEGYLLGQPLLDVPPAGRRQERVVEVVELGGDAHVREQDGAPARLRRVRGQHEPERDFAGAEPELIRRNLVEEVERPLERVPRDASGVRVLAPAPDPVLLFRDVRELEVKREGAQDERLPLRRDRPHRLVDVRDAAALSRRTRSQPHALDCVEQPLALLLDEDPAEHRREQADVAAELCRAAQARPARVRRSATASPITTSAISPAAMRSTWRSSMKTTRVPGAPASRAKSSL